MITVVSVFWLDLLKVTNPLLSKHGLHHSVIRLLLTLSPDSPLKRPEYFTGLISRVVVKVVIKMMMIGSLLMSGITVKFVGLSHLMFY